MFRIEHNVETGEIKEIELTAKEIKELQVISAEAIKNQDKEKAEAEAKATAKETAQSKLAALGLTVEDLQALGL